MQASVLVEIKAKKLDNSFTYNIPSGMNVKVGDKVIVPFGRRDLEGFVLEVGSINTDYKLKDIKSAKGNVLTEELIKLGKYMSRKTLSNLISCYQTMLPKALKASYKTNISKRYEVIVKLVDSSYIPRSNAQKELLERLKSTNLKKDLVSISLSAYKTLLKNNVIIEEKKEVYRLNSDIKKVDSKVELTLEQKKVVDSVLSCKNKFVTFLLHGVTGSGKTEVYMNIIEDIIAYKEVIVLVPEISLTPQFVSIFKKRFGDNVAIMHSGLSDGERYDEYRKIKEGKVRVAIGARSCIFSPFKNLGLIIIDEEHTDTYKQDNNPRYDATDIALYRGRYNNIPVLLGSATPLIESYTRANLGVYKLLELPNRINKRLPSVELVDMKYEIRKGNKILSNILIDSINDCLSKDEQVILLLNRRGYTTTVTCSDCGYVMKCPNCDIPLTYHKTHNKMNCHYCDYTTYKVSICPSCGSKNITSFGLGTEKLQEELERMFNTKVLRMDVDTTRNKGSHERILKSFRNKEALILVGTQMIAKGLDFENVTLVGVVNGDATLNIPDYRAAERTFDLLNQVAGRSGRGLKSGKVIIQGFNLDHYSIKYASMHDYKSFYTEEMNIRKKLLYPPFIDLALIKISSKDYEEAYKEAIKIKNYLDKYKIKLLGPANSNISKINNKYYIQIILKYKSLKEIYDYLKYIVNIYKNNKKVNVDIDINPKKI